MFFSHFCCLKVAIIIRFWKSLPFNMWSTKKKRNVGYSEGHHIYWGAGGGVGWQKCTPLKVHGTLPAHVSGEDKLEARQNSRKWRRKAMEGEFLICKNWSFVRHIDFVEFYSWRVASWRKLLFGGNIEARICCNRYLKIGVYTSQ